MRLYLGLMCADIFELDRIRQRLNTVRKYNNYSLMTQLQMFMNIC